MKKQTKLSRTINKFDDKLKSALEEDLNSYGVKIEDCDLVRKSVNKSDGEIEEEERTVIKYVSTRDVDVSGDIIIPKGVEFKRFVDSGAPVFFGHNYSIPQIGKDEWIKRDEYGIKVKQRYAKLHEGSLPDVLWNLTKQGMNHQSSVGIIPLEYTKRGDPSFEPMLKSSKSEWPELSKTYKGCRRIITKSLLFEHSDVPLACNPNAGIISVAKTYMENGADEVLLKQLGLDVVEEELKMENVNVTKGSADEGREMVTITLTGDVADITDNSELDTEEDVECKKKCENDITCPDCPHPPEALEEVKVKKERRVTLVCEPRVIKLVSGPQVDLDEVIENAKSEVRKRFGRIV